MSRNRTVGQFNLFEFSPVVEDPISPKVDVWVYDGTTILGFTDEFDRLVEATATSLFGFVEGSDGLLYAAVNRPGQSPGISTVRAVGRSADVVSIGEFPANTTVVFDGFDMPRLGDGLGNPFIDPSGNIFFRVEETPLPAYPLSSRNRRYMRLSGSSLVSEIGVEQAVSSWEDAFVEQLVPLRWSFVNRAIPIERDFLHAVLPDGEWVAADPLFKYGTGGQSGDLEFFDPSSRGPFFTGGPLPEINVRVWGNAWWRKPVGSTVWQAVTGSSLSTATTHIDMRGVGGLNIDIFEIPASPSAHYTVRNSQIAGGQVLPTAFHDRRFHRQDPPSVFDPVGPGPLHTNVPWQAGHGMIADATHLYFIGAAENNTSQLDGPFAVKIDINRTPIPATGQAPGTWTSIITRGDFTGPDNWSLTGTAVTRKWVWVAEVSQTGLRRLRAFSKDGLDVREVLPAESSEDGFMLTAGWNARWK